MNVIETVLCRVITPGGRKGKADERSIKFSAAFSWNQATHAYIADHLGASAGHDNLNEMWGSVAPDFFNYVFDPALCPDWVADQTQGIDADTVLKVWDAADSEKEKALAYGFVSHNNDWGADHTAHEASLTLEPDQGYIIIKAKSCWIRRWTRPPPTRPSAKSSPTVSA